MSCQVTYKESIQNAKEALVKTGAIANEGNLRIGKIVTFRDFVKRVQDKALSNYDVVGTFYKEEKVGIGSEQWIKAVPIIEDFDKIDDKRKELGIYETREGIGTYNNRVNAEPEIRNLEFFNGEEALYEQEKKGSIYETEEDIDEDINFQLDKGTSSTASPETIKIIKQLLNKWGVKQQDILDYAEQAGINVDGVNGLADAVRGIVAIAEGKESKAITEEAIHIAVELLDKMNPELVTEMISRISGFAIYKQVFEEYIDRYTTKDGKPDVRKIKKEAVAKLLVEIVINKNEGSTEFPDLLKIENQSLIRTWWTKIIDFFRGQYRKSNISLFEEAADIITNSNIGNVSNLKGNKEGVFLQLSEKMQNTVDKLNETSKTLNKLYRDDATDDVLHEDAGANNWYVRLVDGVWKPIQHRVTDKVKAFNRRIFGDKTFTPEEIVRNEHLRNFGIDGHNAFDTLSNRFIDQTTYKLRTTILERPSISPIEGDDNFETYTKLEKYFTELIGQFDKDSLFLTEKMILNPNYRASKKEFVDGEAGTLDLLILEPQKDGGFKGHIFDWKFMGSKKEDVAQYKQKGYNIQLENYKSILKNNYGIEKFGQVRAIPIMLETGKYTNGNYYLKGIAVGTADASKIEEVRLLPVPSQSERTGNTEIDLILDRLENVYNKIIGEKVEEDLKATKRERLKDLRTAIRIIQTTGQLNSLADAMNIYKSQLKYILEKYNNIKDGVDKLSSAEKNELSAELLDIAELLGYYSNITTELNDSLTQDNELFDVVRKEEIEIRLLEHRLQAVQKDFYDKIGASNGIMGVLSASKVIKGLYKYFKSFDEYSNKAARLIVTLYNKAQAEAVEASTSFNKNIYAVIKEINDKKLSFSKIRTKENTLIDEISPEFFKEFRNAEDREQFIKDNVTNLPEYIAEVNKLKEEKINKIKNRSRVFPGDYEEINKQEEIEKIEKKYNPLNPGSANETLLKYLIKEKWYTAEFKELQSPVNAPLLALYRKIQELNEIAYESGYLEYAQKRTFLPFMEKSLMDKMATNGWDIFNIPGNFIKSLNAAEKSHFQYSQITGEQTNTLQKPFTKNIAEKFDKAGNRTYDYSNTSEQVGQGMILYAQAMYKFQAMSQIDEQIQLILSTEKLKNHIVVNRWNNVVLEEVNGIKKAKTLKGNDENVKTLSDFVQYLIYNNRYPLSQDVNLGINAIINKAKTLLNDKFGTHLEESTTPTSMIKVIDALNRGFSLKTLGLSPIAGAVNYFGANIQMFAQKNDYFSVKDFLKSQTRINSMMQMSEKEGNTFIGLIDLFNPFTENENYQLFKKANTNALGRFSLGDTLMLFMRKGELKIQSAVFESLLKNMMVDDNGNIQNITAFVKAKYKGKRFLGESVLKETNQKIEAEVAELKKTKSIASTAEYKDGKLLINGKEFTNKEEIEKLAILSKTLYRRITGNVSETSINQAKLDIFSSSMMVFKNWIPKLWYTRFGELEARNDPFNRDAYDIGRIKVVMSVPGFIIDKARNISSIIKGTDKGILLLDEMYLKYKETYLANTGEEFTMDREAFNDMIMQNLSNQMRELAILISLWGGMLGLGFIEPPDDDKRAKSALNLAQRVNNQFIQELSFFYNPVNFQQMLSGGMFPALGLLSDIERFTSNLTKEISGFDRGKPYESSEDVRKKSHPIKYGLKLIPGTSAWTTYLTVINPELAKDLDIKTPQVDTHR